MKRPLHLITARYSNPNVAVSELVPVGITRYPPRFPLPYELKANLYDLAPSAGLLAKAKEGLPREEFIHEYEEQLCRIGLQNILWQLAALQGDAPGVLLLCYEDLTTGENWCHRLRLGEWLREHAGLMVTELPDPGKKPRRRKATPDHQGGLW